MKKTIMLAALSIALPFSAAQAQKPPSWPTGAACSPGDGACPAFESEYRGQVSGVWNTLPPRIRETCVSETAAFEKSYRLLYGCLANAMQDFIKNQQRNPEGGDVVQLTPKAKEPEPAQPSRALTKPEQPGAPTPPTADKPVPKTELTPPSAAEPAARQTAPTPPTATEPAPPGTTPKPQQ